METILTQQQTVCTETGWALLEAELKTFPTGRQEIMATWDTPDGKYIIWHSAKSGKATMFMGAFTLPVYPVIPQTAVSALTQQSTVHVDSTPPTRFIQQIPPHRVAALQAYKQPAPWTPESLAAVKEQARRELEYLKELRPRPASENHELTAALQQMREGDGRIQLARARRHNLPANYDYVQANQDLFAD